MLNSCLGGRPTNQSAKLRDENKEKAVNSREKKHPYKE